MWRSLLIGLVMFLSMFSTARSAQAQTTWRGDLGTWDVHAGISTAQSRVVGFLAVQQSLVVAGDNFAVVWFGRSSAGAWSAHAWHNLDIASAIAYARTVSGDASLFANNPDLALSLQGPAGDEPPIALVGGLPEGDPLGEVVLESQDPPPAVVEFLADLGYAAAPLLSGMLALDASGVPASAEQVSAQTACSTTWPTPPKPPRLETRPRSLVWHNFVIAGPSRPSPMDRGQILRDCFKT